MDLGRILISPFRSFQSFLVLFISCVCLPVEWAVPGFVSYFGCFCVVGCYYIYYERSGHTKFFCRVLAVGVTMKSARPSASISLQVGDVRRRSAVSPKR